MVKRMLNYLLDIRDRQRISICLSKGAAMMTARNVDLSKPSTWEFSGFSQNGEDGIIDVLRKQLIRKNRYFIEIGAADGIDNNSAWLLIAEKYNGIMIEGNPNLSNRAKRLSICYSVGGEAENMFVSVESVSDIKDKALHLDPDVFSLDIDGNDYYIAAELLRIGFRPKIFVVEYNSVFGPERAVTIKYKSDFVFSEVHESQLYYGVSIAGWKIFFKRNGYKFITVDQNGVNGFFVDEKCFKKEFLDSVIPLDFAENQYQLKKFRKSSEEQFKLIQDMEFYTIES